MKTSLFDNLVSFSVCAADRLPLPWMERVTLAGRVGPRMHEVQKQLLSRAKAVLAEPWTTLAQEMDALHSLTHIRSATQTASTGAFRNGDGEMLGQSPDSYFCLLSF